MEILTDPGFWVVAGVFIILFWFIGRSKKKKKQTINSGGKTPPRDPVTGKIDPDA